MELSSLSEEKFIILLQVMNNFDEINYFFMNNCENKNRNLCDAQMKSLSEMKVLKRFEGSRFDESSKRRLIENQDTIHELTARLQELQNEVNCLNDSRDFQDAESVRSGLSHVPCQPALHPPFRDPGGMLSHKDKPPDIWDTHVFSGNVFVNPTASSSAPYSGGFNPWIPNLTEHISQDRQPEIHSTLMREDFQRIMEQTNKDCRFRILILRNSLHQQHLLVGR